MDRRRLCLVLASAALLGLPVKALAQEACDVTGTDRATKINDILYLSVARLACTDMRISADSAVLNEPQRINQLFGRVRIDTPEYTLRAAQAQYYTDQGLITAQGGVTLLRKSDSTSISGGENLFLNRAGYAGRMEDVLQVSGGRPHAVLHPPPADSASADTTSIPYEIDADRIDVRGSDAFDATGRVEIRRAELDATADTVSYLGDFGQMKLTGSAQLNTEDYTLTGGFVLISMPENEIKDVIARQNAKLVGDQEITGEEINVTFSDGEIDRLVAGPSTVDAGQAPQPGAAGVSRPQPPATDAAPPPRATATSDQFVMSAMRLDMNANGKTIEEVLAVGSAELVSLTGDSLNAPDTPEIVRHDWMQGDTIRAFFAPPDTTAAAPDSVVGQDSVPEPGPRLDSLIARVNAKAFYRLPAADTAGAADSTCARPGRFAVHYVLADSITVTMKDGVVDQMQVIGEVKGQHLEPPACSAATPAQPASPDTTIASPPPASPDTTAAPPSRGGSRPATPSGAQPQPSPVAQPPRPPVGGVQARRTPPRARPVYPEPTLER